MRESLAVDACRPGDLHAGSAITVAAGAPEAHGGCSCKTMFASDPQPLRVNLCEPRFTLLRAPELS